jgi:cytochrome P450
MVEALTLETIDIIGNETYARNGYPHEAWALLRREAPVYWWDRGDYEPFWAVTRHADIVRVSRQPRILRNAPRLAVFPGGLPPEDVGPGIRHLLNMDPPEHGVFRKLASHRFTPRAMGRLVSEIDRIACEILDALATDGELAEIDFVDKVTAPLTLWVLADMLGVPRQDWRLLFDWTNQLTGANDPEFNKGEDPDVVRTRARDGIVGYFHALAEERRRNPTEDMVSTLANSTVKGKPLGPGELLGYYFLLVVAGNETTRNAASGGLLALIENPGELEKLREDPTLIDSAVEEIVRWTSPVIQFCRTAMEPFELRGQIIAPGQSLCLFYPSANRDEEVFDEPEVFRVDRKPNPHLGFGIGEHFCLGASLARLELRVIFGRLIERLEHVELAGGFERVSSSFLGGVKHMPIRYRMRPAA